LNISISSSFFIYLLLNYYKAMSKSQQGPTERSSLLDRRRSSQMQNRHYTEVGQNLSIPLPSPFREQEPITFPTTTHAITPSQDRHRFKWFNKRTGSYDEDRQDLVKENTGVRVWSESYSSIGKYSLLI
jgi:chloride channel 3/4/5